MGVEQILKIIASIIIVVALIFAIVQGVFSIARILYEIIVLILWGIVGYILIKILESVWKNKKVIK